MVKDELRKLRKSNILSKNSLISASKNEQDLPLKVNILLLSKSSRTKYLGPGFRQDI